MVAALPMKIYLTSAKIASKKVRPDERLVNGAVEVYC